MAALGLEYILLIDHCLPSTDIFKKYIYLFIWLFLVLAVVCQVFSHPCSLQTLSYRHVGSSAHSETEPGFPALGVCSLGQLDHQGSPLNWIFYYSVSKVMGTLQMQSSKLPTNSLSHPCLNNEEIET